MNKVILMGRLTRDPELKSVGDKQVCEFRLAVQRRFNHNEADFLNCSAWGKTGEFISKYFKKGKQIGVVGRIETRSWEDEGKRRYTTNVIVEEAYFVGGKSEEKEEDFEVAEDDDELPF